MKKTQIVQEHFERQINRRVQRMHKMQESKSAKKTNSARKAKNAR